jgi:glucose/arabinose dehydrogenase
MSRTALATAATLVVAAGAACAQPGNTAPAAAAGTPGQPLETRPANAPDQRPAAAGQTRAPSVASGVAYDVTVVATGLTQPWAVEPLADGAFLVTEKPGRLRVVSAAGAVGAPIAGVPAVDARGQGGLLDVALSPSFARDRLVFWSFTEPRANGENATSVARGVLSADRTRLDNVRVILHTAPGYTNNMHYGSRLAFGPDGMLYVTMGERSDKQTRPQAQQLGSHLGKVLRIRPDGTVPPDNPYVGRADARPEIWSLGHRNVQAATFDAGGRLWEIEHGARGGDELNLVQRGRNYGWPVAAYGIEYAGGPITTPGLGQAVTTRPNTEQPVYYWDPVIAPSGAAFYTGSAFPRWRNSLFVGALGQRRLVRLEVADGRVTGRGAPARGPQAAHPRRAAGAGRGAVRGHGRRQRRTLARRPAAVGRGGAPPLRTRAPRMRRSRLAATLLLLAAPAALRAQAAPAPAPTSASSPAAERAAVLATIVGLFDAMRAGDSARARAAFHPRAQLATTQVRAGAPEVRLDSLDAFVRAVGTPHPVVWDERLRDTVVQVDGPLAQVWTGYAFFAGPTFSHCGVDAFTLGRTAAGWRILALADTRQRTGCPEQRAAAPAR